MADVALVQNSLQIPDEISSVMIINFTSSPLMAKPCLHASKTFMSPVKRVTLSSNGGDGSPNQYKWVYMNESFTLLSGCYDDPHSKILFKYHRVKKVHFSY